MTYDEFTKQAQLWIVAVVVATEVPPDSPDAEFRAVIDVMRNRAKVLNKSLVEIVLTKNQFSAVCREDYWRKAMAGKWMPAHVQRCYEWLQRDWVDITEHATHYYSPISMIPQGRVPAWANPPAVEVEVPGARPEYFRFFRGIPL